MNQNNGTGLALDGFPEGFSGMDQARIHDADGDYSASYEAVFDIQTENREGFLSVISLRLTRLVAICWRPDIHICRLGCRTHTESQKKLVAFAHTYTLPTHAQDTG